MVDVSQRFEEIQIEQIACVYYSRNIKWIQLF